jgi:hypothetical protein
MTFQFVIVTAVMFGASVDLIYAHKKVHGKVDLMFDRYTGQLKANALMGASSIVFQAAQLWIT